MRCSRWVDAKGLNGYGKPCGHNATVERDGKPYCTRHDPERVKLRAAKERESLDLGFAYMEARDRLESAESAAIRVLREWSPVTGNIDGLLAAKEAVCLAEELFDEAKDAVKANRKVSSFFFK